MPSITTSLSPNAQTDDVLLAIKLLFSPWKWKIGKEIYELEEKFKKYFQIKHSLAFNSGRTSLLAILSSLNFEKDSEIIIQSYTCVAVPAPIIWSGYKPIYVDIKKETLNMCPKNLVKKITSKTKAIIIQNTFGNPSGLSEILDIARKNKILVIEDCSHCLGAKYNNKKIGTFGDIAFFSFGRDKVISSVFGSMIITNNDTLFQKIKKYKESSCSKPSNKWIIQQLLHPIIFSAVKPFYTFFSVGKIILEISKRMKLTSKAVELKERNGKKPSFININFPNALACLALNQFKKLENFNNHRNKITNIYNSELSKIQEIEIINTDKNSYNIYLRYTILVENPETIFKFFKQNNIYLGNWYNTSIAPNNIDYTAINYDKTLYPIAEQTASKTINLPTHIHITEKHAFKITKLLVEFFIKKQ